MRTEEEILAESIDEPAFSNGAEWEIWSDRWCWHPCKKDRNEDCPLIMIAICFQRRPKEWIDAADPRAAAGRYECTEFEPDDQDGGGEPEPWPQPVAEIEGQTDLFGAFADQIAEAVTDPVGATS